MKQVSAHHSRQHLVPSLRRLVRVAGNTPVSSSNNPFQARTASSSAKSLHRHGTFEEVAKPDVETLVRELQLMSVEEIKERTRRRAVEHEAFMEEARQQSAAIAKELDYLEEEFDTLPMMRLRRVAVEILLRACGKQEHWTTPSALFAQLVEAKDSGLQQVAASLGMELAQLGQDAEAVLAHQDSHDEGVELLDMEDLEYDVCTVQISMSPTLKEMYPRQCYFVQAYEVIKQAVPERFT